MPLPIEKHGTEKMLHTGQTSSSLDGSDSRHILEQSPNMEDSPSFATLPKNNNKDPQVFKAKALIGSQKFASKYSPHISLTQATDSK